MATGRPIPHWKDRKPLGAGQKNAAFKLGIWFCINLRNSFPLLDDWCLCLNLRCWWYETCRLSNPFSWCWTPQWKTLLNITKDTYWIVRGLLLSGMNKTARGVHWAGFLRNGGFIPLQYFLGTLITLTTSAVSSFILFPITIFGRVPT